MSNKSKQGHNNKINSNNNDNNNNNNNNNNDNNINNNYYNKRSSIFGKKRVPNANPELGGVSTTKKLNAAFCCFFTEEFN